MSISTTKPHTLQLYNHGSRKCANSLNIHIFNEMYSFLRIPQGTIPTLAAPQRSYCTKRNPKSRDNNAAAKTLHSQREGISDARDVAASGGDADVADEDGCHGGDPSDGRSAVPCDPGDDRYDHRDDPGGG